MAPFIPLPLFPPRGSTQTMLTVATGMPSRMTTLDLVTLRLSAVPSFPRLRDAPVLLQRPPFCGSFVDSVSFICTHYKYCSCSDLVLSHPLSPPPPLPPPSVLTRLPRSLLSFLLLCLFFAAFLGVLIHSKDAPKLFLSPASLLPFGPGCSHLHLVTAAPHPGALSLLWPHPSTLYPCRHRMFFK